MKRALTTVLLASIALGSVGAGVAHGFASDHTGEIDGDPPSSLGFDIDKTPGGNRNVTGFISVNVQFSCDIGTPGRTDGLRQLGKMRVADDGTFKGSGEVVGIPVDPHGTVKGELRHGGKAVGTLRLRGELDGSPGSECDTGKLEWKAQKLHF